MSVCEAIGEDEVYSCMTMFKYVIRVLKVGMTIASIVIPSFKTTVVGGVRTWYDNCFVCHTEVSMKLV